MSVRLEVVGLLVSDRGWLLVSELYTDRELTMGVRLSGRTKLLGVVVAVLSAQFLFETQFLFPVHLNVRYYDSLSRHYRKYQACLTLRWVNRSLLCSSATIALTLTEPSSITLSFYALYRLQAELRACMCACRLDASLSSRTVQLFEGLQPAL